ncbi:MAG: nucleotidyl transferase AbiEii/AbiGii toxin family protein [Chlorobia bacterium]|nr:nucleotidyl transferase AbiEii/AbiGii toxin family protein [Fimbriimonadaceae bacterium]
MTPIEILAQVSPLLQKANIQFWVGGSVASSVWSEPRYTNDIDVAVMASSLNEELLRRELLPKFYIGPTEISEAFADRGEYPSFQILDTEEAFKFDMFVVRDSEYSHEELERAKWVEIQPGVKAPIASPEDIVLHKIRWFVSGGKVSDRQWNDLVKVIENQLGSLDNQYMIRWARHFGIEELLQDAFDQAFGAD